MTAKDIIDAWMDELVETVPELADALPHKYASWSLEKLYAEAGERHIAIWFASDAAATASAGLVVVPSSTVVQTYAVVVWEAVADPERLMDDDAANLAWLRLEEAIRARFMVKANIRLGDASMRQTLYAGSSVPAHSTLRVMEVRFACTFDVVHT